jgi:hypothetical protein
MKDDSESNQQEVGEKTGQMGENMIRVHCVPTQKDHIETHFKDCKKYKEGRERV